MGEIKVTCADGIPRSFKWRGRPYIILAVLERWKDAGRWWESEPPKFFFRVETAGGGLWEIYQDMDGGAWRLYKIYD